MSSLFNSYEGDLDDTLRALREGCAKLQAGIDAQYKHEKDPTLVYHPPPATGPLSRAQQLQVVQQALSHAKDLLTSMTYEMSDLEPSERAATRERLDLHRKTCNRLDGEVAQLRQSCSAADRADLLHFGVSTADGGTRDPFVTEANTETQAHRLMALQTTQRLQGGTNTLAKAEAYLAQTNSLGRESLNTLRTQTEQIVHIQETTNDVDAEILQSRAIINQMQRTALRHRLKLIMLIFLLVAFILLLLYYH
ncbi:hypothetical protein JKF63_04933 [Porcisia hertigi]|uniref:Uncharacterized protein n=1 Tax=Porcisia hertigi TaxID=2761500 RepID=A0A836I4H0_9TRYP|nr:hypothetical protein JKF63_04933 [Porcisia hertigi]